MSLGNFHPCFFIARLFLCTRDTRIIMRVRNTDAFFAGKSSLSLFGFRTSVRQNAKQLLQITARPTRLMKRTYSPTSQAQFTPLACTTTRTPLVADVQLVFTRSTITPTNITSITNIRPVQWRRLPLHHLHVRHSIASPRAPNFRTHLHVHPREELATLDRFMTACLPPLSLRQLAHLVISLISGRTPKRDGRSNGLVQPPGWLIRCRIRKAGTMMEIGIFILPPRKQMLAIWPVAARPKPTVVPAPVPARHLPKGSPARLPQ